MFSLYFARFSLVKKASHRYESEDPFLLDRARNRNSAISRLAHAEKLRNVVVLHLPGSWHR
jgi:hypothetical protein